MRKIDLSTTNLEAILKGEAKRRLSARAAWHILQKTCRKVSAHAWGKLRAFFGQYTVLQHTTFALFATLLVATITAFIAVLPAFSALLKLESQVADLRSESAATSQELVALASLKTEIASLRQNVAKLHRTVPSSPREEDVVVTLTKLINLHQLATPKRIFWNKEKETAIASLDLTNNFDVYVYTLTTSGTFTDLHDFLRDLTLSARLLDVKSLKLVPLADGSLELSITLWAYNLKS